jgi:branched-chain amino acid transport system substrate-binding protein
MPRRRLLVPITVLTALALLVFSCTDELPARREVLAPPVCPDRQFGCVEVGPSDPIRIGTLLVTSGENAAFGTDTRNGALLAADFLSRPGNLLGHRVRWIHRDDACGHPFRPFPRKIVAVIGPSCASAAAGYADVMFSEKGIVLISPFLSGPALTDPLTHQPFFFRTMHNDRIQGHAMADFAFDVVGGRRAATIADGSPYSVALGEAFAQTFRRLGGTIAAEKDMQRGDVDLLPLLRDLAARDIDFLYVPIFVAEGGLIAEQARTIPELRRVSLAAADALFTPDFVEAAGTDNAEGIYVSSPDILAFRTNHFYRERVLPAYERRFGNELFDFPRAYSFDAATLVFHAIEKVSIETSDGGLLIPRTGIRDALAATRAFPGLTGTLSCNESGDCQPEARISIYQIHNGAFGRPVFRQTFRLEE